MLIINRAGVVKKHLSLSLVDGLLGRSSGPEALGASGLSVC